MKVIEFTVRFQVGSKEEEATIRQFLAIPRCNEHIPADKGVKESGKVAYTPSTDHTKAAAEALTKCKRVAVLRLEVLEVWANAYPHIDLASEIAKCEAWAESKSVTRTPRGWQKALNSWLSKAQDKTRGNGVLANVQTNVLKTPVVIDSEVKAWIEAAK